MSAGFNDDCQGIQRVATGGGIRRLVEELAIASVVINATFNNKLPPLVMGVSFTCGWIRLFFSTSLNEGREWTSNYMHLKNVQDILNELCGFGKLRNLDSL